MPRRRRSAGNLSLQRQPVHSGGEDVLDRLVAERLQAAGTLAGCLKSVVSMDPAQAHDPQTGAIALLRMRAALHDLGDQVCRGRPGFPRPGDQPRRRPFSMGAVCAGHMFGVRGPPPAAKQKLMGGYAPIVEENLHGRACRAHIDPFVEGLVELRMWLGGG